MLDPGLGCVGVHCDMAALEIADTLVDLYIGFDLTLKFWGHGETILVKLI